METFVYKILKSSLCTGNITEAVIGQIKVKVLCGDITKETTEAIVSSTNTNLNLSSGNFNAMVLNKALDAKMAV